MDVLEEAWEAWIMMTGDSPFSFLDQEVRSDIFRGNLPGLNGSGFNRRRFYFDKPWTPIFGRAQHYIDGVYKDGKSWEIHFKPQTSYGEFEQMIHWFREALKKEDQLFGSPGHQRIVFPIDSGFKKHKMAEFSKVIQALIVTSYMSKEIEANTSIIWKAVHADRDDWEDRGALRIEPGRWGEGNYGIEFRMGLKSNKSLRRFILWTTASRVIGRHWDDLENASSWELVRPWPHDLQNLGERFRPLSRQTVRQARYHWEKYLTEFHYLYYIPFWNWEDAPFLSQKKKKLLRKLSREFIKDSAGPSINYEKMLGLMARWVKDSAIVEDLALYASPVKQSDCRELIGEIL